MGILTGGKPTKNRDGKGTVRFITKQGAPVVSDAEGRPRGTAEGQPNTSRAAEGVCANARTQFTRGRNSNRKSVYDKNRSGVSRTRL